MARNQEWHLLSPEEREKQSREMMAALRGAPDTRSWLLTSIGLDDQDSILAVEAKHPTHLPKAAQALRESKAYRNLRLDTPTFICVRHDLRDIVEHLG